MNDIKIVHLINHVNIVPFRVLGVKRDASRSSRQQKFDILPCMELFNRIRNSASRKFCLVMFIIGTVLLMADIASCIYLSNNWGRYANHGQVEDDDIRDWNEIDLALLCILRSNEYKKADEQDKSRMISRWAKEYRDKTVGWFVRMCFFWFCLGICGWGAFCPYDDR